MNWKLWDDEKEDKLDGNADRRITDKMASMKVVWRPWPFGRQVIERAVLDIKTDVNLWPYDDAVATTGAHDVDPSILETFEIQRFAYGRVKLPV